jgi:hypothetical protein
MIPVPVAANFPIKARLVISLVLDIEFSFLKSSRSGPNKKRIISLVAAQALPSRSLYR